MEQDDVNALCAACDIVVAINDAYRLLPNRGDGCHVYGADPTWWSYHIDAFLDNCNATGYTQHLNWEPGKAEGFGLTVIKSKGERGLSRDPNWLHQGQNSGYQGINLAYHLLRERFGDAHHRILLTGFDMSRHGGEAHWFGEHPKGLVRCGRYETYADAFRTIKPKSYNLEIINCSRRTALDAFPRMSLEDAL